MHYESNPELELARKYVEFTNVNIFLTGKAGTGKTTFLKRLQQEISKQMIVVAPTGVAAVNAGGTTIHSFFQLSLSVQLPSGQKTASQYKLSEKKQNIIRAMDLLVIDEISMVRADLLDAVDGVLRRCKKNNLPFGGVQLLMIGDIHQLSPIASEEEMRILREYYSSMYFFHSIALNNTQWLTIELKHIYRQKDSKFIALLNNIRNEENITETLSELNRQYNPHFKPPKEEDWIYLTTHNRQAQEINDRELTAIKEPIYQFKAKITGEFAEQNFPTHALLELKKGAQVMFIKNHPDKRFYNGKIGRIREIDHEKIEVVCGDESSIEVTVETWKNVRYTLDEEKHEIQEEVIGTFTQYPLKLAWAITIHKSQGLTFERTVIDAGSAFAFGQLYVALSRCKQLSTIVLKTRISQSAILQDRLIKEFDRYAEERHPTEDECKEAVRNYFADIAFELIDFRPIAELLARLVQLFVNRLEALYPRLAIELSNKLQDFNKDFITVSDKFSQQIKCLLTQDDEQLLQDRIQRAVAYFYSKLYEEYFEYISNMEVSIDNKEYSEQYKLILNNFKKECNIKLHCLKSAEKGLHIATYLKAKSVAAIETIAIKRSKKSIVQDVLHPELYKMLETWRNVTAERRNVHPFIIIQQESLLRICNELPTTLIQLKKTKGVGKVIIANYGKEIMDVIQEYLLKNDVGISSNKKLFDDLQTSEKTLYYFQVEQKSIEEISNLRSLTPGTICKHLTDALKEGIIGLERLVPPEKVKNIKNILQQEDITTLTEAKNVLGEEYSYDELRFVQAMLQNKNKD